MLLSGTFYLCMYLNIRSFNWNILNKTELSFERLHISACLFQKAFLVCSSVPKRILPKYCQQTVLCDAALVCKATRLTRIYLLNRSLYQDLCLSISPHLDCNLLPQLMNFPNVIWCDFFPHIVLLSGYSTYES